MKPDFFSFLLDLLSMSCLARIESDKNLQASSTKNTFNDEKIHFKNSIIDNFQTVCTKNLIFKPKKPDGNETANSSVSKQGTSGNQKPTESYTVTAEYINNFFDNSIFTEAAADGTSSFAGSMQSAVNEATKNLSEFFKFPLKLYETDPILDLKDLKALQNNKLIVSIFELLTTSFYFCKNQFINTTDITLVGAEIVKQIEFLCKFYENEFPLMICKFLQVTVLPPPKIIRDL